MYIMYCMVTHKSTVQHSVKLAQKKFMTKVGGGGVGGVGVGWGGWDGRAVVGIYPICA